MKFKPCFLILSILFFSSCFNMFKKEKRLISQYKIDEKNILEIYFVGLGATTKDVIEVREKNINGSNRLVSVISGFDDSYRIEFKPINDSLIKIIFRDTSIFKGMSKDFLINLRDSVKN